MDVVTNSDNIVPISVLHGSRAVVEKKDYITAGLVTLVEGDLIEIEIGDSKAYKLGDPVKVKLYSPNGSYLFVTSVIAIDDGCLVLVHPPEHQKRFVERREYPRVDVCCKGRVDSVRPCIVHSESIMQPFDVNVQNISMGGIGIHVDVSIEELPMHGVLAMNLDINLPLPVVAQVVRRDLLDNGRSYGLKYLEVDSGRLNTLRAFVLRTQVEARMQAKQENRAAGTRRLN